MLRIYLKKGAAIREIQSLLEHANLTHTERYTLHTDRHLRKAVELMDHEGTAQSECDSSEDESKFVSKIIVTIKSIYKDKCGLISSSMPVYFSHFIVSNEGKEPAIDFEIGLFNSKRKLLQGRRDPVLMISLMVIIMQCANTRKQIR